MVERMGRTAVNASISENCLCQLRIHQETGICLCRNLLQYTICIPVSGSSHPYGTGAAGTDRRYGSYVGSLQHIPEYHFGSTGIPMPAMSDHQPDVLSDAPDSCRKSDQHIISKRNDPAPQGCCGPLPGHTALPCLSGSETFSLFYDYQSGAGTAYHAADASLYGISYFFLIRSSRCSHHIRMVRLHIPPLRFPEVPQEFVFLRYT